MNNRFDFEHNKIMLIILLILIFFAGLIIRAFDLAQKQHSVSKIEPSVENVIFKQTNPVDVEKKGIVSESTEENSSEEVSDKTEVEESDVDEDTYELMQTLLKKDAEEKKLKEENISKESLSREELLPINENEDFKPLELSKEPIELHKDDIEYKFIEIQTLKKDGKYDEALRAYTKVADNAKNDDIKARCYEEMSRIFAIQKRYGSAITYAQKANNLVPTSERELLIARLYYKVGYKAQSNQKLNNVLNKDFRNEN